MAEKKKRDNRISEAGIAVYPRVTGEPDTQFDKDGSYSIKVRYEASNEKGAAFGAALKKEIDERMKATLAVAKKEHPAKVAAAKAKKAKPPEAPKLASTPYFEDEESGDITFSFKMKASGVTKDKKPWNRKPAVFDAKGTPVAQDIKLGGGSIVKVSFEPSDFYTTVGAGVSLRLNAVQIIELVEWTGGTASSYGFEEEEGFTSEAPPDTSAAEEEGFTDEDAAAATGSESDDF